MIILYSIFTTLCLVIGFYFGFKIGETKQLPSIKIKTKKQKEIDKEEEKETQRFIKSIGNMERFDGTTNGQEDIV